MESFIILLNFGLNNSSLALENDPTPGINIASKNMMVSFLKNILKNF